LSSPSIAPLGADCLSSPLPEAVCRRRLAEGGLHVVQIGQEVDEDPTVVALRRRIVVQARKLAIGPAPNDNTRGLV